MNDRVSITLITRNRYNFFLQCFASLLSQTFKNWDCIIIDDSDEAMSEKEAVKFLLKVAQIKGHEINFIPKENLGICQAWQKGLEESKSEFGFRLEDDVWLEPNYLRYLYDIVIRDEKIGAVAGLTPNPFYPLTIKSKNFTNFFYKDKENNLIPDDRQGYLIEDPQETYEVCHLHRLFIYRKSVVEKVGGFATHMTRIAHRDETDLTLRLYFSGYKLLICPKAILWHAVAKHGGSRDDLTTLKRAELQKVDEQVFQRRVKIWQKENPEKKLRILNS